ncbi:Protein Dok-7 [Homalodisca vitripennis]|nr:Protein Dok-7 [Homalodisca vitripennis]
MMHASDRAASSPSLIEHSTERCRKKADTELHRATGSSLLGFNHSVSAANSPYLRRRILGCLHESTESDISSQISRKRSCSSDSTNNLRDMDFIMNKSSASSINSQNEVELIKNSSTDTICNHRSPNKKSVDFDMTPVTYIDDESRRIEDDDTHISESNDLPMNEGKSQCKNIDWAKIDFSEPVVHIRRSSSVPSKSSHNRDSSSSNDSGVSTSSLKKRKADFVDGGIQDCSSGPSRRYTYTRGDKDFLCECFHLSLPRRSKSVDPLRDLAFQFQKVEVPMKSSSAEAEVPICHPKRESRGCLSPGAAVPYIDSRSTSSGTSDMSDYFETLSLSSFSSSDTPDSLHFGHQAVSTMRPRSGKEYQKIDRNILETDLKRAQPSKSGKESTSATEKEG